MPAYMTLALLLALLLASAKLAGHASVRVRMPAILGELLVGVLLGPSLLNVLGHLPSHREAVTSALGMLAEIGALLLMFIAGLETDMDAVKRASGTALLVAVFGVVAPLFGGLWVARAFGLSWTVSWFLGGALTATSVSISAQTLMEMGQMMTTEASTILGAAVIDDILGLFVLALLSAGLLKTAPGAAASGFAPLLQRELSLHFPAWAGHALLLEVLIVSLCMCAFLACAVAVNRWGLYSLLVIGRRLAPAESLPSFILGLVFLAAAAAQWLGGMAGITGAYLLGVALANSEIKAEMEQSLRAIGYGFLIPLFFVSMGLLSNVHALEGHWMLLLVMLVVAIAGKLLGCGLAARCCGSSPVAAARIGVGMISRGEVGLIIVALAQSQAIFNQSEAALIIAVVLATTLLTPPSLRWAFSLASQREHRPATLLESETA